ncbi:MAG: ATP-dependent DNA helicase [bacterium]|nr:ATP-dependent DNA helicase [bacterium]
MQKDNIYQIFEDNGLISAFFENYEKRSEQIEMALAIEDVISSSGHLIVEAGTGVGKSLAYLVPFIYWAVNEKKKVIVSTQTKTLQQQLVEKDLPFLEKALTIDFSFALCLGGENYLCLRRASEASQYGLFDSKEEREKYEEIRKWQRRTKTGLKQELSFEPNIGVWSKVCRVSDLCIGKNCPYRDDCFYNKARKIQYKSHILICNHHLFFANLASGGSVLPNFDAVVFDEAHNIEDVATSYLGIEVSNFKIMSLCDELLNPKTGKGLLARLPIGKKRELLEGMVSEVKVSATNFFSSLAAIFGDRTQTSRIRKPDFIYNHLKEPLASLSNELKDLSAGQKEEMTEISAYALRADELNRNLEMIIGQSLPEYVYWIEIVKRPRYSIYTLHGAPINMAEKLKIELFDQIRPIVLTSATLATNGSFDYIKGRLGLKECREVLLSSPFNYQDNVLLYTPNLPDPNTEPEQHESYLIKEIEEILSVIQGGTFVLFTSFKLLNRVYEKLKDRLHETAFKQGDLPRYRLVEEFKKKGSSVLFGTNTFWQGIDVPGKSLQCVIITKLPFAVPDDPICEARMELLLSQNLNPFIHYQIPQAIIMLKQGFGRLIRTKQDYGMIAILDPRIKTRFYGRWFTNSLPVCQQTLHLEEAEEFFRKKVTRVS